MRLPLLLLLVVMSSDAEWVPPPSGPSVKIIHRGDLPIGFDEPVFPRIEVDPNGWIVVCGHVTRRGHHPGFLLVGTTQRVGRLRFFPLAWHTFDRATRTKTTMNAPDRPATCIAGRLLIISTSIPHVSDAPRVGFAIQIAPVLAGAIILAQIVTEPTKGVFRVSDTIEVRL